MNEAGCRLDELGWSRKSIFIFREIRNKCESEFNFAKFRQNVVTKISRNFVHYLSRNFVKNFVTKISRNFVEISFIHFREIS
jgi:hypothetical protein